MRFLTCFLALTLVGSIDAQTYEWKEPPKETENGEGRFFLWRDGKMIGVWFPDHGHYRAWLGGDNWGTPTTPPHPAPAKMNFGLDEEKIGSGHSITMNGKEITRSKALDMIEKQRIPDDSKKFRLVIIGPDADRKRVADAWGSMDAEIRDRFAVWSVPADHWSLKDGETGETIFKCGGSPTVYCQAPGGKVLHRQDSFGDVGDLEAIRKAVKKYDQKDPDLRKPDPNKPAPNGPAEPVHPMLPIAGLLGAAGAYYLVRKDKA